MINRRLDYIFISNKRQEFSNKTDIIPVSKQSLFCFSYYFQLLFFKTDASH